MTTNVVLLSPNNNFVFLRDLRGQEKRQQMHRATLSIDAPTAFNFWRTAYSHGWADLPPFSYNAEKEELTRLFSLSNDKSALAKITANKNKILVSAETSRSRLTPSDKKEIIAQLSDCLRLNEDFSEFHRLARTHSHYRWIASSGSGRMLRAPTVFEDAVKMICTTNCSWAFTKIMITNLSQSFGNKYDGSIFSFPTPEAIAGSTDRFLREEN